MKIWKFKLDPFVAHVSMPTGARIIDVHEQNGGICVWAEVDPMQTKVLRNLVVVPTGNDTPPNGVHVGSAHLHNLMMDTQLVFHVYDCGESVE